MNKKQVAGLIAVLLVLVLLIAAVWWVVGWIAGVAETPETTARTFAAAAPLAANDPAALEKLRDCLAFDLLRINTLSWQTQPIDEAAALRKLAADMFGDTALAVGRVDASDGRADAYLMNSDGDTIAICIMIPEHGRWLVRRIWTKHKATKDAAANAERDRLRAQQQQIEQERQSRCSHCNGRGKMNSFGYVYDCTFCNGTGRIQ